MRSKKVVTYEDGKALAEIALASSEAKPTDGLATGSTIVEVDTGKNYVLDEDSATWTEYSSGGGGGSAGGGNFVVEVEVAVDEQMNITVASVSASLSEIQEAFSEGKHIEVAMTSSISNATYILQLSQIDNLHASFIGTGYLTNDEFGIDEIDAYVVDIEATRNVAYMGIKTF